MANPKSKVAPSYGEGDIEAKAMTEAADGKTAPGPEAKAKTPPPDAALPASGTTETDLSRNLQDKADRQKR